MGKNGVYAYAGKVLRVNLSNHTISTEPTLGYAREWLGASGVAAKILYDEVKPWVTAYEPANKLIIGAGALVGTMAPGASRINANSISPMTNGWGQANSDSHFGGQLKYAGYDSIIVEGKAHNPVYIWICDDCVQIRDASHLWGKTTWDTLDELREEHHDDDIHTVSIGPAGENLARGACIIQDKGRAMGRTGLGVPMGAKNLKAIAVRGTGAIRVADPVRFMKAVDNLREMIMTRSKTKDAMKQQGTPSLLPTKYQDSTIVYKNFQFTTIPEEMYKTLNREKIIADYQVREVSYPACAFGCSRYYRVNKGPFAGLQTEGFQWEVFASLQTKLGIEVPGFAMKANSICNQMGIDVDVAGGAIAWAMECYQRGILTKEDTDGLELEWGDYGVVLELLRKICYREGFGDILAEGCAKAADITGRGSEYYAMHTKGVDVYEILRGTIGWCLGITTSTRGCGHVTGAPLSEFISPVDPEDWNRLLGVTTATKPTVYEGKAKMVEYYEDLHRVNDCLGICHFVSTWLDPWHLGFPEMAELYSAATGWETSADDLRRVAKRQLNLEKAFNLRRTGFDRKDDYPTPRDMTEAIPTGYIAGWKLDLDAYNALLDEYYELHNWDKETSFPTRKCLEDLDLNYVADDLEKIGKLR